MIMPVKIKAKCNNGSLDSVPLHESKRSPGRLSRAAFWLSVISQFALPLSLLAVPAATAGNPGQKSTGITSPDPAPVDEKLSGAFQAVGSVLAADDSATAAADMARAFAADQAGQSFRRWLNQFGPARLQFNTDRDFRLNGSALDVLLPLYETREMTLFTQWGIRNQDHRNTANVGLGVRRFLDDRMYGVNTFFDNDLTGHNRRAGIGAEARIDFLKLSVNGYFSLTGWHQSRDFADYDERPANGYDVRAEAWLPYHPQLGGKLLYEQYRGDDVALFGSGRRQKNPYAVTAGLSYTPIPILTLGADYRAGKGGHSDTGLNVQVNYRPGDPWHAQIDPAAVAGMRTLAAGRHDLVERNNQIVLAYQKQQLIRLDLPGELSGQAGDILPVTARVKTKYGLGRIDWRSDALVAAGGDIAVTAGDRLSVTLPDYRYQHADGNVYTLAGVAYDSKGNASNPATATLRVVESTKVSFGGLEVVDDFAVADGRSAIRVRAQLRDGRGRPLAGKRVSFTADNDATVATPSIDTDQDGMAMTGVYRSKAGVTRVRADTDHGYQETEITFVEDGPALLVEDNIKVSRNNAVADGQDRNEIEVLVTDKQGNALSGQGVAFIPGAGNPVITEVSGTTGEDGIARAKLTNTASGISEISVRVGEGPAVRKETRFIAGRAEQITLDIEAHPSASSLNVNQVVVADGGESFHRVIIQTFDKHNNPAPNAALVYSAADSLRLSGPTGETDQEGRAVLTAASLEKGDHQLSVALAGGNGAGTVPLSFKQVEQGFSSVRNGADNAEFALGQDFPKTAFTGANFTLFPVTVHDNLGELTWTSSHSAVVTVEQGKVSFHSQPTSSVVIEASRPGYRFSYRINVDKWFVRPGNDTARNYTEAFSGCASRGMRLPFQYDNARELAGGNRGQAGGGLLAEWGPMNHYGFPVIRQYWAEASPAVSGRVAVDLKTGAVSEHSPEVALFSICLNESMPSISPPLLPSSNTEASAEP